MKLKLRRLLSSEHCRCCCILHAETKHTDEPSPHPRINARSLARSLARACADKVCMFAGPSGRAIERGARARVRFERFFICLFRLR